MYVKRLERCLGPSKLCTSLLLLLLLFYVNMLASGLAGKRKMQKI